MHRLERFRQRDTRRVFVTILAGKLLGVGTVLAAMKGFAWLFGAPAEPTAKSAAAAASAAHQVFTTVA